MQGNIRKMHVVGSVLAGGIIGAGVALLFAPQSGRRTRREIRYLGQKVGLNLRHKFEDLSEKVQDGMGHSLEWTKNAAKGATGSGRAYLRGLHRIRHAS